MTIDPNKYNSMSNTDTIQRTAIAGAAARRPMPLYPVNLPYRFTQSAAQQPPTFHRIKSPVRSLFWITIGLMMIAGLIWATNLNATTPAGAMTPATTKEKTPR